MDPHVDLRVESQGLAADMGSDQDHIERIFPPGQADRRYQHRCRVTGTVTVGHQSHRVDGRDGKQHS